MALGSAYPPTARRASRCDGGEPGRATVALRLFVIVCLYVLFLPSFAPLLDHHFVEKVPNHAHVYLGQSGPGHAHPFETQHRHQHAGSPLTTVFTGPSEVYDGPNGIVYLAPYEGTGQSVTSDMLTVAPAPIVFYQPPGDPFRFGLTGDGATLLEAFIGPLEHPPRV